MTAGLEAGTPTGDARAQAWNMRNPFVETLGVRYHPHLLNVVLLNVEPMQEKNVIDDIDQHLRDYRMGLWKADFARQHHLKIGQGGDALQAYLDAMEDAHRHSLLARPVHTTVFGAFGIGTVFTSTSFGLCHCFGGMDRVVSQQVLLGTVPSPTFDCRFGVLRQNPDMFLCPFDHAALLDSAECPPDGTPEHAAMQQPILVFSQLQVSGLISTISASNLVLPLMLTIDARLRDTVAELRKGDPSIDVTALLMDIQGWSDYALILRTSSYEAANECVERMAGLTLEDVLATWRSAMADEDLAESLKLELGLELQAMDDRLKRMSGHLTRHKPNLQIAKTLQYTHLFGSSISTMGILWPYCNHAIAYEYFRLEKPSGILPAKDIYDGWNISGEMNATIQICTRPGHYCDVRKIAKQIMAGSSGGAQPQPVRVYPGSAFGTYNVIIPGEVLSTVDAKPGLSNLKELVGRLYYLRWALLGKPTCRSQGKNNGYALPWFDERDEEISQKGISILTGTSTLLCGVRHFKDAKEDLGPELRDGGAIGWSLDTYYAQFVRRTFPLRSNNRALEHLTGQLKNKGVSWHLRDTLTQVMSLWRSEMADPAESNRMVELADGYLTWSQVLLACLHNPRSTKGEIEDFLCTFTQPFGQAVVQRVLTGYHMSEYSDFTAEYKGGMTKNLTAIDGLMKSMLALVGSPQNTGGLALIGHDPMPTIEIGRISSNQDEYAYAVMRLNFIHLVHPIKIATVLHEVLHVIVQSHAFRSALAACGGEKLAKEIFPYNHHRRTLQQHRLEEMLIEHIVGYLLFADKPELYTSSYLVQMVLHADSSANDAAHNHMVIVEHLCRCFMLELLLKPQAADVTVAELMRDLDAWWRRNARFVLNIEDNEPLVTTYGKALAETLEKWVSEEDFLQHVQILRQTVALYFGNDFDYEDTAESKSLRTSFINRLIAFRSDPDRMKDLRDRLATGEPVHVVFKTARDKRDQGERLLRVRRLESLVAYLCLIRAFYESMADWMSDDAASKLHLQRDHAGTVDFGGGDSNAFLLDRLRGTLFTITEAGHNAYALMRMSLLKSLWQLAEVTKHSEIIYLLMLGEQLSKHDIQLFVPTKLVEEVLDFDWEEQCIQPAAE